jgi:hypothetical protein
MVKLRDSQVETMEVEKKIQVIEMRTGGDSYRVRTQKNSNHLDWVKRS